MPEERRRRAPLALTEPVDGVPGDRREVRQGLGRRLPTVCAAHPPPYTTWGIGRPLLGREAELAALADALAAARAGEGRLVVVEGSAGILEPGSASTPTSGCGSAGWATPKPNTWPDLGGTDGLAGLEEAVELREPTPARLEHARALVEHGAALRRSNRRVEARERLQEGAELAHRIGALAFVAQANQELAATGARPRTLLRTGPETLTESERRVAQLAAEGMSNKEAAQAPFLTVKTVETHLSSAYRKLGIASRRQLAPALAEDR